MLTGAWAATRVKNRKPEFDFEVHSYPVLEDGSLLVINADTRLSVNADSEHMEAALKFVDYFTRPDNIQKFADQQSSFSPLKEGSPLICPGNPAPDPLLPVRKDGIGNRRYAGTSHMGVDERGFSQTAFRGDAF